MRKENISDETTGLINHHIHFSQQKMGHPTTGVFISAHHC